MHFPKRNPTRILFLLAALAVSGVACTRPMVAREPHAPPAPAAAAFGSTILRVGHSVTFGDGLRIELKDINDSRCKPDVQCVWAGELTANLSAQGGDFDADVQSISLGATTAKHRAVGSYDFVLVDASISTATVIVTKPGPQR